MSYFGADLASVGSTRSLGQGIAYVCLFMSDSLRHQGLWSTRLLCPWGFSRQEY